MQVVYVLEVINLVYIDQRKYFQNVMQNEKRMHKKDVATKAMHIDKTFELQYNFAKLYRENR